MVEAWVVRATADAVQGSGLQPDDDTLEECSMFQVVTRNSVYNVSPAPGGFRVRRMADLWGRRVNATHEHLTSSLRVGIGEPMVTEYMRTSPVRAIVGAPSA